MGHKFIYEENGNDLDTFHDKIALTRSSLPNDSKKYWNDRYSLFTRFDEGIYMTPELWYSVTPESVAIFVAKFVKYCLPDATTILDLFCGGGGNSIQFARFFPKLFALDYNEDNVRCTLHNARVYGVRNKIELIKFDWSMINTEKGSSLMKYLQNQKVDFIFSSPPWGGVSYNQDPTFDLDQLQPFDVETLLRSCFAIADNVCLLLPRKSDLDQLSRVTRDLGKGKCKVLYTFHTGRLKGILLFWGDAFTYQ